MIQRNIRTKCWMFKNNPCPFVYRSTEAYKYQGCYELAQKKNALMDNRLFISKTEDISNTATVPFNTGCSAKKEKTAIGCSVFFVITIISTIFNGGFLIWMCYLRKKKNDLTEKNSLKMRPLSRRERYITSSRNSWPRSSFEYELPTTVSRI
eukprot:XP_019924590.1 PREDICTED: uncharacterized protein LOC105332525 [Crassostrea gigas]